MNYEDLQEKLKLAHDEQNKGNYDEAERLAAEVLAAIPPAPHPPLLKEVDSSKARRRGNDDTEGGNALRAKATHQLGVVAWLHGDYHRALELLNSALEMSEANADQTGIAFAIGNIGNVYQELSDHPRALEYYAKSIEILEQLGNKADVAAFTGNIGWVYHELSDYSRALEYHAKSLEINEQLGNKTGVAINTCNIGIVYKNLSDYPRALEYYAKSLDLDEQLGNKAGVAANNVNIGNVYNNLSDYPRALEYYAKALELFEQIGSKLGVAYTTGNIGDVYNSLSDYPRALEYHAKALELNEQLGNKTGVATNIGNIGLVYAEEKFEGCDFAKAEKFLLKAIAINQEIGSKKELYEHHKPLAELYEKQELWKEYSFHFKKFHTIKDEVQSEEARHAAENLTIRQAIAEKEREAELQKLKAQQLEQDMKRQQQTLSDKTLHIVQQTEMLQNFKSEMEGIMRHADTAEKVVRAMQKKIKELPENVLNWERFAEDFRVVHPVFEENLKAAYPELTASQIKMCCLLRIGLNTREIATLLFLSERTVEGHRLRIRNKLATPDGNGNLHEALMRIA